MVRVSLPLKRPPQEIRQMRAVRLPQSQGELFLRWLKKVGFLASMPMLQPCLGSTSTRMIYLPYLIVLTRFDGYFFLPDIRPLARLCRQVIVAK